MTVMVMVVIEYDGGASYCQAETFFARPSCYRAAGRSPALNLNIMFRFRVNVFVALLLTIANAQESRYIRIISLKNQNVAT